MTVVPSRLEMQPVGEGLENRLAAGDLAEGPTHKSALKLLVAGGQRGHGEAEDAVLGAGGVGVLETEAVVVAVNEGEEAERLQQFLFQSGDALHGLVAVCVIGPETVVRHEMEVKPRPTRRISAEEVSEMLPRPFDLRAFNARRFAVFAAERDEEVVVPHAADGVDVAMCDHLLLLQRRSDAVVQSGLALLVLLGELVELLGETTSEVVIATGDHHLSSACVAGK